MVKQPARVWSAVLALALVSFGCDFKELSDENQYYLNIGLDDPLGSDSHRVLVGSTFPLFIEHVVRGDVDFETGGGIGCATRSGSGVVVELEDGIYMVEAAGNGAVELADPNISCPANTDILAEFGPDRWSVIGTDPADVTGRWAYWHDTLIADHGTSPGHRGAFPDVVGRPIDDLRVAANSQFQVLPALVRASDADQIAVRWRDDEHELTVPAHYADLLPPNPDDLQMLDGVLRTGESFEASVTILGTSFRLPPVHAVPVESITSLELVPVYDPGDAQREWGSPRGVLAIARDGEGRRVFGAPVEFELTRGRLSMSRDSDALYVGDLCRDVPEAATARGATIVASVNHLESSVDLEWIALPDDDDGDPGDSCEGGCTCTSATPNESAPGLLALVGLGVWLRRRSRKGP